MLPPPSSVSWPEQRASKLERLPAVAGGGSQLTVLRARNLETAQEAIAIVRANGTVVLNCETMPAELAQRLLDVIGGGLCAIDGSIESISAGVALLRPAFSALQCAATPTQRG